MSDGVSIKEQKSHIRRIKALMDRISAFRESKNGECGLIYFTEEEWDLIHKALYCHWAVIKLDIKARKKKAAKESRQNECKDNLL